MAMKKLEITIRSRRMNSMGRDEATLDTSSMLLTDSRDTSCPAD